MSRTRPVSQGQGQTSATPRQRPRSQMQEQGLDQRGDYTSKN